MRHSNGIPHTMANRRFRSDRVRNHRPFGSHVNKERGFYERTLPRTMWSVAVMIVLGVVVTMVSLTYQRASYRLACGVDVDVYHGNGQRAAITLPDNSTVALEWRVGWKCQQIT